MRRGSARSVAVVGDTLVSTTPTVNESRVK